MAANERDVGDEEAKLKLTIKTTKRKETVEIAGEATVKQVTRHNTDYQRYCGKIFHRDRFCIAVCTALPSPLRL